MPVHRINLKGPWEYEWVDGVVEGEPEFGFAKTGRVKMPTDWLLVFGTATGTVRFRRRFHRPTNLAADERVWIAFAAVGGVGTVAVNGATIGSVVCSPEPQRFDATDVRSPRHRGRNTR